MPDLTSVRARRWLVVAAAAVPLLVCLVLAPLRRHVPNTSAALILVLVVVAFASAGNRPAGFLAACAAGLGFDFIFTRPYQSLAITSGTDIQTTVLLVLVGLSVTQIAHWGFQQRAQSSRRAAYLEGLWLAAQVAATGATSPSAFTSAVGDRIAATLGLSACRFDYGSGHDHPRLHPDGSVHWHRQQWDVAHLGMPTDVDTELVVESGGRFIGRYLLTAPANSHPSRIERQVAAALAAQVGAALHPWREG